jgi:hypothetical protein
MSIAESGKYTQRTRHISLRYFRVTEVIRAGEIKLQHKPTGEMAADMLTKHLAPPLFIKHRRELLNEEPNDANLHICRIGEKLKGVSESGDLSDDPKTCHGDGQMLMDHHPMNSESSGSDSVKLSHPQ